MAKVWKISEAASLGFHAIAALAPEPDQMLSTGEIASRLEVSAAHLSKVLQRLAKADLVRATRGPRGGFMLEKNPEKITLLEVYEAIEGPLNSIDCLFSTPICGGQKCIMGGLLEKGNREIREYLEKTRLSDLGNVYSIKKEEEKNEKKADNRN